MASFTRTNGLGHAHGTQYSTSNLASYEVDCIVDVSGKGGIGSTIEAINQALQPVMTISSGSAGKILMIVDNQGTSAAQLQVELQNLGTVDSINLASATVTAKDIDSFVLT